VPRPAHMTEPDQYDEYTEQRVRMEILSRKYAVVQVQLCSGHSKLLCVYCHTMEQSTSPLYPKCGEDKHTVEHWFTSCGVNNNNNNNDIYSAVIMTRSLREFTRFIW